MALEPSKEKLIPFNKPALVGREVEYMNQAVANGHISGNGRFTKKVQEFIENSFGVKKALLTTSCTDALEMAAILLDINPGDQVMVPSFTFVSTANAFVSRGATPVFIDIKEETLNIDEELIEERITNKTKAMIPVHYGGVGAAMERIMEIANRRGIGVVEDAAQCVGAKFNDQHLGAIGHLGALSFHETKNLHCGEGGALLINDPKYIERGEIIWEKGTDRGKFFRGEVDKYTWVDVGSSFLMSDLWAAYLFAQFEKLDEVIENRRRLYKRYGQAFCDLANQGRVRLPVVPDNCQDNAHIFYLILNSEKERNDFISHLRRLNIHGVFHYLPLHLSPMGKKFGGEKAHCPVTEKISSRLLRLPLYHDLTDNDQERVIKGVTDFFL